MYLFELQPYISTATYIAATFSRQIYTISPLFQSKFTIFYHFFRTKAPIFAAFSKALRFINTPDNRSLKQLAHPFSSKFTFYSSCLDLFAKFALADLSADSRMTVTDAYEPVTVKGKAGGSATSGAPTAQPLIFLECVYSALFLDS